MKNRNMDSFYEENGQYVATTTAQSQPANNLKRPITLDLNAATNNNKQHAKKQRFNQSVVVTPILNSPDLNMLTMATPDIEKFIISTASALQTPTPSLLFNGNSSKVSDHFKFLASKMWCLFCINFTLNLQVTSEQADYARGFEDALNEIRTKEQQHQQTTAQPQQQNGTTKFTSGAYIGSWEPLILFHNILFIEYLLFLHWSIVATIPTTSATTSTILSMSGGSVTYTDLGKLIRS